MRKNNKSLALILLIIFLIIGFAFIKTTSNPQFNPVVDNLHDNEMEIHFIDVGQGDSVLIKQGNHNMLIDAGDNKYEKTVVNYLQESGVIKLDYVIGTHPHADHIGGLDAVIDTFEVEKVLMPKVSHTSKTYEDVLISIKNKNLKIITPKAGDNYKLGDAIFTIVAPNSDKYNDLNNYSIVTNLNYGKTSFLFTGDAEGLSEKEMLEAGHNLKADLLKVGHHGSNSSTTIDFLNAVNPAYAVIQVGKDNKYNHPSDEILIRLEKHKVQIYRNDLNGNIIAISNKETIKFHTEKKPAKGDTVQDKKNNSDSGLSKKHDRYIGNKNSKIFHTEDCNSLPIENNRVYFESYEEAIKNGYTPCSGCNPKQ